MKTIGFVFARGGSKGLPGKNLKLLCGKPLIAHAIEIGLQVKNMDRVIVSTDDERIAEVAKKHGAHVPFLRPAHLATDDSSEWLSWQHAVDFMQKELKFDTFVSIPATAPLRTVQDVELCIDALDLDSDLAVTVKHAASNPYFSMLVKEPSGYCRIAIPSANVITRRQDAPEVFEITPIAYVTRPDFIKSRTSIFDGKMKPVLIPSEYTIDIDTALDFEYAEFLMSRRKESVHVKG
jgi:N,N'-diacetyl-8-epilegionaminate cytidylyltransferase